MKDIKSEVMAIEYTTEEVKAELIDLYERYKAGDRSDEIKTRVDDVLEKLFRNPHTYSIPMSFINTEIGRTLFKIKLEMDETTIYGATEIAIVGNLTRSWVNKAFQTGLLEGEMAGGRYFAREEAVIMFLTIKIAKPLTEKQVKEKMSLMRELKKRGATVEEMKQTFGFEKSLMHRS